MPEFDNGITFWKRKDERWLEIQKIALHFMKNIL